MDNRAVFYRYKGNCCANCGKTVEQMIERFGGFRRLFELNHVDPAKKSPVYKNLIRRSKLSEEQLDEVDKCVLLCDTCHNALHMQGMTVESIVTIQMAEEEEPFYARITSQVLYDGQTGKLNHFCDEPTKLQFCRVQLGKNERKTISLFDLGSNDLLCDLLAATAVHETLTITDMADVQILQANKIDEENCRLVYHPEFPLIRLQANFGGKFSIHIRNGVLVSKQGVMAVSSCSADVTYEALRAD